MSQRGHAGLGGDETRSAALASLSTQLISTSCWRLAERKYTSGGLTSESCCSTSTEASDLDSQFTFCCSHVFFAQMLQHLFHFLAQVNLEYFDLCALVWLLSLGNIIAFCCFVYYFTFSPKSPCSSPGFMVKSKQFLNNTSMRLKETYILLGHFFSLCTMYRL